MPRPSGLTKNFHPDFIPAQVSSVDNPEYHLTGGDTNDTIVTSTVPSVVTGAPNNNGTTIMVEPQSPAPNGGRSPEDESDHEYYNDFDRLQRELQPLRRNETTV